MLCGFLNLLKVTVVCQKEILLDNTVVEVTILMDFLSGLRTKYYMPNYENYLKEMNVSFLNLLPKYVYFL
jgi:hypothetical protein